MIVLSSSQTLHLIVLDPVDSSNGPVVFLTVKRGGSQVVHFNSIVSAGSESSGSASSVCLIFRWGSSPYAVAVKLLACSYSNYSVVDFSRANAFSLCICFS